MAKSLAKDRQFAVHSLAAILTSKSKDWLVVTIYKHSLERYVNEIVSFWSSG
jgi:hypothetical protein